MDEKDVRVHVETLQSLQREINFLRKTFEASREPSVEKIIEVLRNSQNALYNSLSRHGITPEDAYRIIMENNDRDLVREVLKLQKSKDTIRKNLANPKLTPEKHKSLERLLTLKSQQYTEKWNEVLNNPNKDNLIKTIERGILRIHTQSHDHTRDPSRDQSQSR